MLMSEDVSVFQSLLAICTVSVITLQSYYFDSNSITQFDHWPYLSGTNTNWLLLDVLGNTKDGFLGSDLQVQSYLRVEVEYLVRNLSVSKNQVLSILSIFKSIECGVLMNELVGEKLVVTRVFKNIHSPFSRNSTSRN